MWIPFLKSFNRHDFLIIGSGAVVDENVVVTLTGDSFPEGTLVTESHQAWMRFMSDESMTATGFQLSYESKTGEGSRAS